MFSQIVYADRGGEGLKFLKLPIHRHKYTVSSPEKVMEFS